MKVKLSFCMVFYESIRLARKILEGRNVLILGLILFDCLKNSHNLKRKSPLFSELLYPEPESNRHALRHWCLRPTRLPIPPSGHSVSLVLHLTWPRHLRNGMQI